METSLTDVNLTNDNLRLVQSNSLICAEYNLDIHEHKIINTIISLIGMNDDEFKTFSFSPRQVCDICGWTYNNLKPKMNNLALGLMKKVFYVYEEKEINEKMVTEKHFYHWVNSVSYSENKFVIQLSDDLIPYLLMLKKEFTSQKLSDINSYSLELALRLDMYFSMKFNKATSRMAWEKRENYKMVLDFSVEDFKKLFGYEKKYDRFNEFYSRIILPAVEEINNYRFFNVSVQKITDSFNKNRCSKLIFTVSLGAYNEKMLQIQAEKHKRLLEREKSLAKQAKLKQFLINVGFSENEISDVFSKFEFSYVYDELKKLRDRVSVSPVSREEMKNLIAEALFEKQNVLISLENVFDDENFD